MESKPGSEMLGAAGETGGAALGHVRGLVGCISPPFRSATLIDIKNVAV